MMIASHQTRALIVNALIHALYPTHVRLLHYAQLITTKLFVDVQMDLLVIHLSVVTKVEN